MLKIGIRREDKNKWERRVPLTPEHVKKLKEDEIQTIVQPSKIRIFSNEEYEKVGAIVKENMSECSTIFAVKEIPIDFFEPRKTYVFFSHTTKGQKYNMPMLKKMMDLKCNLIEYEKIENEKGIRLLFFGRYAGIAGIVDTLWAYGQRLQNKNITSPLSQIKQTMNYNNLDEIKNHFRLVGKNIQKKGFPNSVVPLIIGIAGYGNVSKGVQEILDELPIKEIMPLDIKKIHENPSNTCIYKVVFKEKDTVEPVAPDDQFDLQDYYKNPDKYRSIFEKYCPYLTILMNCIYWTSRYPRLITKDFLRQNFGKDWRLEIVGDISIDINGAIEFSEKATNPDNPVYVYNPLTNKTIDGFKGEGIVVMGVDNLPCELPKESSMAFSKILHNFVPKIARADFNDDFDVCNLPSEIKKAVILYQGKLTPKYQFIDKYL